MRNALKVDQPPPPTTCFALFSAGHSEPSVIGATGVDEKRVGVPWEAPRLGGLGRPGLTVCSQARGVCQEKKSVHVRLSREISMGLLVGPTSGLHTKLMTLL